MSLDCTSVVQGIPSECRKGNNYVLLSGLFLTTPGFQFDTAADAGDDANWLQGVVDKDIFPIHNVKEIEDLSGEDVRYESPGQDKKELFEGKRSFKISLDLTLDQHKVLRSYAGKNFRLFWYDRNNNILGTSPDTTVIKGFQVSFIDIEKLMMPTAETPVFSKLEVQLEYASELDDLGVTIMPYEGVVADRWAPYNIGTMTTVEVTQIGTVTANEAVFDVKYESNSDTGNDGNPVVSAAAGGLDVTTFTNFTFTDGSSAVVPTAMTEDSSITGRYTATFTTFTSGDVQIDPTVDNLYESAVTTLT